MTQEEKQLLLVDLCGRLMYRVECFVPVENCIMELTGKRLNYFCFHKEEWDYDYSHEFEVVLDPLNDSHNGYIVKPYLRPISSMTDEEKQELLTCVIGEDGNKYFQIKDDGSIGNNDVAEQDIFNFNLHWVNFDAETTSKYIDWLNAHHFDYRGLIPMGLALEAPKGMYKEAEL